MVSARSVTDLLLLSLPSLIMDQGSDSNVNNIRTFEYSLTFGDIRIRLNDFW